MGVTGYQVKMYRHIERSTEALERIAEHLANITTTLAYTQHALEKLAAQGEIQGMREAHRDRAAGLHDEEKVES